MIYTIYNKNLAMVHGSDQYDMHMAIRAIGNKFACLSTSMPFSNC